jgi:hypothetical protein
MNQTSKEREGTSFLCEPMSEIDAGRCVWVRVRDAHGARRLMDDGGREAKSYPIVTLSLLKNPAAGRARGTAPDRREVRRPAHGRPINLLMYRTYH